jgi:glutamate-1-semialdehyde 2,1-aminomutase
MLERGFLATNSFYATYAHNDKHIASYLEACEETFKIVAEAIRRGTVVAKLKGPVAHTGFWRLT